MTSTCITNRSCINLIAASAFAALMCACTTQPMKHESFQWRIDPSIAPSAKTRGTVPIAAFVDEAGQRSEFAEDQLLVGAKNIGDLDPLLQRTGGIVLRELGTASRNVPGYTAPSNKAFLIRIDPLSSDSADMAQSLAGHVAGKYAFSSDRAARTAAAAARERATYLVGLNFALKPIHFIVENTILEQPDGMGGFVDFETEPYMTDTLDLSTSKLGIGILKAWDYLWYEGIPFGPNPWTRPLVAIIDGGFALDENTGAPLNGNLDFEEGETPIQLNETVDEGDSKRHLAGGKNLSDCGGGFPCPWHGTGVFSTAAATPHNQFGAAGSGGVIVKPIFIRTSQMDSDTSEGIFDAAKMGASVINISSGDYCHGAASSACAYFGEQGMVNMKDAVNFARGYSLSTIVAAAGNNNEINDDESDDLPCTLDGVLCVGAIDSNGNRENYGGGAHSGAGKRVAIWAPDCELTTPNPDSPPGTGKNSLVTFCGTSAATPFVSGIVGLMKALNPNLDYDQVKQILQQTALPSPDPDVTTGYVNAFAAVQAVKPNLSPTIQILEPPAGTKVLWGQTYTVRASISDPEQDPAIDGVTVSWSSNLDGTLCGGVMCDTKPLSPGMHEITATVTDPYGATATAHASLQAIDGSPPYATITNPSNGAAVYSTPKVILRGSGGSENEPSIPDSGLTWTSSIAGVLGTGHELATLLPVGTQKIVLTAETLTGLTGSSSINVSVLPGTGPTVTIQQPANNASFGPSATVTMIGTANDPVDGPLSGNSITWSTDIDGVIGHGTSLTHTFPGGQCAIGTYHLTMTATNSAGRKTSSTILVYVGLVC